jgi:cytochrome c oxidase assembly protein subunit 15
MASTAPAPARDRAVAAWLLVCAAFVATMVAVGGLTRLTRSGLSIVEWKPILGAIPPLGDAAWQEELAKYQASPEAKLVNVDLSLEGFKQIYYVEWFHRLLGRLTGIVVLVPLVYFVVRRRLDRRRIAQLAGLFALGGLQGALGWFMVQSGLVDQPHVSPYRLTAHLLLALLLFAALVWVALDVALPRAAGAAAAELRSLRRGAAALLGLLALTITWGGLMAGFHAGLVAPTFPTVNGAWVPDGMWQRSPAPLNFVANPLTIHVTHRCLAYLVVCGALVVAVVLGRSAGAPPRLRRLGAALAVLALGQATLGVLTVLTFVQITWASLHQLNAVLLLGALVAVVHQLSPARAAPVTRA